MRSLHASHPRAWLVLGAILSTLLVLLVGVFLPAVSFDLLGPAGGDYSVVGGVIDLVRSGNLLLAFIIATFSLVFPVAKLGALLRVWVVPVPPEERSRTLHWLERLGKWSMLDVFVIVVFAGAVRLGVLAQATAKPGIYVFASAVLASVFLTAWVVRIAHRERPRPEHRERAASSPAGTLLDPVVAGSSVALFVAGLLLPLLRVEEWVFWEQEYSLVAGTLALFSEGEWLLGTCMTVFVGLIPLAKLAAAFVLSLPGIEAGDRLRAWLLAIDGYSMLDVFGLALLVVLSKLGGMVHVEPRIGLWILAVASILSIYVSWRLRRRIA